jgi:hypothetical protein
MSAPAETQAVTSTAADRVIAEWSRSASRARRIAAVLGWELLDTAPGTPVDSSMKIVARFGSGNSMTVRARNLLADAGIIYQAGNGHYYAAGPEARLLAGQLMTVRPGVVPHHGPIRAGCPLECLLPALSLMSFNRLKWADDPARTVGDVMNLLTRHQLGEIRGLGPRRIAEISQALHRAGPDPAIHRRKAPIEH